MFFSIILIPLVFSPCYSTSSIKDPSDYLFGNTELITKDDFLNALSIDSLGFNKNLTDLSLGPSLQGNFDNFPFYLYIKENYFGLFKSLYLEAKRRDDTSSHLLAGVWKKIYERMLEKTVYQDPIAAFKFLFGIPPYGTSPGSMCSYLKGLLWNSHKEWTFIFEKGGFDKTKFAFTLAFLIFDHLNPYDKYPHYFTSGIPQQNSLSSENSPFTSLYGSVCPDGGVLSRNLHSPNDYRLRFRGKIG